MELFFMTRGIKREVDEFVKWMETRALPLVVNNPDGTKGSLLMECQLRPVQLWDFVFPKENLDVILNTFNFPKDYKNVFSNYNINPKVWALRKMLGLTKIPEVKDKINKLFMPYDRLKDVNFIGIGIKDDGVITAGPTHERI